MERLLISHRSSIELLDTLPRLVLRCRMPNRALQAGAIEGVDVPLHGTSAWLWLASLIEGGTLPLSLPIETLAPHEARRRANGLIAPHGYRRPPRASDVLPLRERGLCVTAPELAFVQLCAHASTIEAIELGMQLTGTYRRLGPKDAPSYAACRHASMDIFPRGSTPATCVRATAYNLRPLTSVARLDAFARSSPGLHGIKTARQAIPLIRAGLRSPLEAELYLRCFLPRAWGGLGLAEPAINRPLALTRQAAALAGTRVIVPDFSWPGTALVVEALGKRDHDGSDGITGTSRREKAYRAMGMTCLTITAAEMRDFREFFAFAGEICRLLGEPLVPLTEPTLRRARLLAETIGRVLRTGT